MSRTKHHRNQKPQHRGKDFWSKRVGMGHYSKCPYGKSLTHRKERIENKDIIRTEVNINENS